MLYQVNVLIFINNDVLEVGTKAAVITQQCDSLNQTVIKGSQTVFLQQLTIAAIGVNKLPFDVAERWIIGSINRSYGRRPAASNKQLEVFNFIGVNIIRLMVKAIAVGLLYQLLIAVVAWSNEVFLLDYLLAFSVTNNL
ncbi:Uncharacterised protein [Klebsiella pneumoniae]|nr:Uncharacterised protein [Enterobacter hormaechei]SAH03746.1 Uncharacterised protein [Enterobacter cloacae]SLY51026.1 Uncharacterised protein [Klebsiella quasivariicola]SYT01502.1 Uncharacterised protein [Klebsiella pneumoniae]CZV58813.1 Uncharacterised protein [Enterobacter hormaechei]